MNRNQFCIVSGLLDSSSKAVFVLKSHFRECVMIPQCNSVSKLQARDNSSHTFQNTKDLKLKSQADFQFKSQQKTQDISFLFVKVIAGKSANSSLSPCPQLLVNLFRNFDGKNYTTFLTTHETEPIEPLRQLTKHLLFSFQKCECCQFQQ